MSLVSNYLMQLLFSVGIVIGFGVAINFLNRTFYGFFGRYGYRVGVATGFIGTPIHELAHALMCVIFGHKVREIKLFPSLNGDKTLGYVNHSYNKKNLYHLVGNFFIGVAPVIVGPLAIYLLMLLLTPVTFDSFVNAFLSIESSGNQLSSLGQSLLASIKALFAIENLTRLNWWIFIILASSISIHMSVSPADIKGSKTGFLFIAVVLFAVDFAFFLVEESIMFSLTDFILRYSVFVISFLTISVILCLALLLIALILRPIFQRK